MIPYPGVKLALKHANGDRAAARRLMREAILAGAERQAAVAGLSLNCEHGNHGPHGCLNDGSGCICECHDTPAGPYTEQETTQ